jgi:hypothetical protein
MTKPSVVLASAFSFALVACAGATEYRTAPTTQATHASQATTYNARTVYVWDCGREVAVDLHGNNSLYLKGTDIPFRYGDCE